MDPVLCQDINSDASQEATGIQDTKASCLDKVTTQQPLVDQEINERLKELKDISALPKENSLSCLTPACSGVRHVSTLSPEERLSALNALYNSDMDELERAGEKYKYWDHLYLEARKSPIRNAGFEESAYGHILRHLKECRHYMQKIRITEEGIKKLDPGYTPCPKQWYE